MATQTSHRRRLLFVDDEEGTLSGSLSASNGENYT